MDKWIQLKKWNLSNSKDLWKPVGYDQCGQIKSKIKQKLKWKFITQWTQWFMLEEICICAKKTTATPAAAPVWKLQLNTMKTAHHPSYAMIHVYRNLINELWWTCWFIILFQHFIRRSLIMWTQMACNRNKNSFRM